MIAYTLRKACCSPHKPPISGSQAGIDTFNMPSSVLADAMKFCRQHIAERLPSIGANLTECTRGQLLPQSFDRCSRAIAADITKNFVVLRRVGVYKPSLAGFLAPHITVGALRSLGIPSTKAQ